MFYIYENKLQIISSERLIMPCKRNKIGTVRNSKLYKPQQRTIQHGHVEILHLRAFYRKISIVRFFIVSLIFRTFTFTVILFP